jgi:hypothetical protein
MAVYLCIFPSLLPPLRTRHRFGSGTTFLSCINNPHPASEGEHYAQNTQIYCEGATWSKEIRWRDPRGENAAIDRTGILS